MSVKISIALLLLLVCCGVSHAKDERWNNFAEDSDLKYYIDQQSIISLPDNVYIFWVKSVPKQKDYFKKEYNVNDVSYMFTSYELDCAVSSFRTRGTIMFDKNRKEINKSIPEGEIAFEPVPPESMLELVQGEVCVKEGGTPEAPDGDAAPEAAHAPQAPTASEEPPALQ